MHELCNLVKEKTCFKNMQNPKCIDLLLTNNVYAFQQTIAICTGLSDCDKPSNSLEAKQNKLPAEITNKSTFQLLRMS